MLGKLVNGQIIRPDDILFYDDITIINPTEETLREEGFIDVEETTRPDPEDGFYFESHWEEIDGIIKQVWNKIEIPTPPEPEDDIWTKINKILLGKEQKTNG